MKKYLLDVALLAFFSAQTALAADNVVLITIDGVRWQEAFSGISAELATHNEYSTAAEQLMAEFWHDNPALRAQKLMPFLHNTLMQQGTVVGDHSMGSCAVLTNNWNFSYPGYNEILSGVVNDAINSNAAVPNPEKTLLELLSANPVFSGRVAAFASWNVFPAIYNVQRSGIPVNVGLMEQPANEFEVMLNALQKDVSPHWPAVRHDAFTHHYAMSWLKRTESRLVHIAYGEPDDFAHEGDYDEYVLATHRVDGFVEDVWNTLQSLEYYKNNTALFITVDHGRGEHPADAWLHHASQRAVEGYMTGLAADYPQGIVGSENIWMAAMGPGVPAHGLVPTSNCVGANQIAATLMRWMGEDYTQYNPSMGKPMAEFLP
ncbi:MAG: phosphoglyceromutase [Pseudohongiella sp.]|nr:phosphoglyceromutase [Pseudohongiella sp.]MDP2128720.1 phosphoglyceromutase [Pseudohongiella sp.]